MAFSLKRRVGPQGHAKVHLEVKIDTMSERQKTSPVPRMVAAPLTMLL
jgi:hypothetical protein